MFRKVIPFQLGSLFKLHHLDLHGNTYFDSVPIKRLYVDNLDWLSNLTSLTYLDMTTTDFSRAIHWIITITSLPTLAYVALAECQLSTITLFHSVINSSTSIATFF